MGGTAVLPATLLSCTLEGCQMIWPLLLFAAAEEPLGSSGIDRDDKRCLRQRRNRGENFPGGRRAERARYVDLVVAADDAADKDGWDSGDFHWGGNHGQHR